MPPKKYTPQNYRASFSENVDAFIRKTNLKAATVLRKLGLDGYTGMLLRAPVDTGRFRGNMRIAVNTVDTTVDESKSSGDIGQEEITGDEQANALQKLAKVKWGDSISITNSLPYAVPLENGHSPQAPGSGAILKRTFDELKASFDDVVRRVQKEL